MKQALRELIESRRKWGNTPLNVLEPVAKVKGCAHIVEPAASTHTLCGRTLIRSRYRRVIRTVRAFKGSIDRCDQCSLQLGN